MDELEKSTVIRAGQRPAMALLVPLNLFIGEILVLLILLRFMGFWCVAFVPIHFWFVIKTAEDIYWIRTMRTNFSFWSFISNKGLKGKDVVTFTPSPIKAGKNDYADFD